MRVGAFLFPTVHSLTLREKTMFDIQTSIQIGVTISGNVKEVRNQFKSLLNQSLRLDIDEDFLDRLIDFWASEKEDRGDFESIGLYRASTGLYPVMLQRKAYYGPETQCPRTEDVFLEFHPVSITSRIVAGGWAYAGEDTLKITLRFPHWIRNEPWERASVELKSLNAWNLPENLTELPPWGKPYKAGMFADDESLNHHLLIHEADELRVTLDLFQPETARSLALRLLGH